MRKYSFALCLLLASVSVDTILAHAGERRAVPSETVTLPNLRQPVEILIDHWGVPHIYARNEADLFFAQGFNAARDRLFQIDLWRRRGLGQLSELFGPAFVDPDSPHYRDLAPMWRNGQYFPLLYSRTAVENATEKKIELVPGTVR